jgi:hypothetical protein
MDVDARAGIRVLACLPGIHATQCVGIGAELQGSGEGFTTLRLRSGQAPGAENTEKVDF